MDPVFEQSERRVRCVGPRKIIAHERVFRPGHDSREIAGPNLFAVAHGPKYILHKSIFSQELCAPSIVRKEHDHRVLFNPELFQLAHDSPDPLVHAIDLGGIHRHPSVFPVSIFNLFPGRGLIISWGQFPFLIDNLQLYETVVAVLSHSVPAVAVFPFEQGNVFRQGV
ncbi:hypothetical protein ES708_22833 [subsurface metagenome]